MNYNNPTIKVSGGCIYAGSNAGIPNNIMSVQEVRRILNNKKYPTWFRFIQFKLIFQKRFNTVQRIRIQKDNDHFTEV